LTPLAFERTLREVAAEIVTLWHTAKLRCEMVLGRFCDSRVLLWMGGQLVFEQIVTNYPDAMRLAAELKTAYDRLA